MTIDEVKAMVCERYKVNFEDVCSLTRKEEIVLARHIIQYLLNVCLSMKTLQCSLAVGRINHSSTIHARKNIENYIFCEVETRNNVNYFMNQIYEGLKR